MHGIHAAFGILAEIAYEKFEVEALHDSSVLRRITICKEMRVSFCRYGFAVCFSIAETDVLIDSAWAGCLGPSCPLSLHVMPSRCDPDAAYLFRRR